MVNGLRHSAGCRGLGRRAHLLAGPLTGSATSVLGKVARLASQPSLEIAAASLARASVHSDHDADQREVAALFTPLGGVHLQGRQGGPGREDRSGAGDHPGSQIADAAGDHVVSYTAAVASSPRATAPGDPAP